MDTLSVGLPSELIPGDASFRQPLVAPAVSIAIPVGLEYNRFLAHLTQGFTVGAVTG